MYHYSVQKDSILSRYYSKRAFFYDKAKQITTWANHIARNDVITIKDAAGFACIKNGTDHDIHYGVRNHAHYIMMFDKDIAKRRAIR